LHSFVKKSQKTPKKELALAKKRKKEISWKDLLIRILKKKR
jgi:phage-related protein